MGLLSQGAPHNWEETRKYADHIRKHGVIQFLNIYNKVKERQKDVLKWGDEVSLPLPQRKPTLLQLFVLLKLIFKCWSVGWTSPSSVLTVLYVIVLHPAHLQQHNVASMSFTLILHECVKPSICIYVKVGFILSQVISWSKMFWLSQYV